MKKIECYSYNPVTKELIGKRIANAGTDGNLISPNCTLIFPPAYTEHETKPVWTGTAWELKEDHRRYLVNGEYVGGTCYWLPEDDYTSEGHYMTELGPLPDDAIMTRPPKPQDVINREQMLSQIAEAKSFLRETDYRVIKCAEQGLNLEEEYPGLKAERQSKRDLINQVEESAQLAGISLT